MTPKMTVGALLATTMLAAAVPHPVQAQQNPCAPKANPCAPKANPCAPKANPCAPKANPCAAGKADIDRKLIVRPKGTKLAGGNYAALVKRGEALFKDTKLSTNGMSCQSCHENNASFLPTFSQAYPHAVAMAKERVGLAKINFDEMVQLCMVVPMAAKPLPWGSAELAALVAYNRELQKAFRKKAPQGKSTNPCAPKANPCAPKANPCAPKANPCSPKK